MSGIELAYPEAVPVRLGGLGARIATAMSATRTNAPTPPDGPGDDADSSSDSDDSGLPIYQCTSCDKEVALGGGGILECSHCRSRRTYSVGDNVALLGLRLARLNNWQGEVVCRRGDRYGVLLVGASEPVAVRPVNLRPIDGAFWRADVVCCQRGDKARVRARAAAGGCVVQQQRAEAEQQTGQARSGG